MNILLVVPEYPPHVIGGGGAVYIRVADYLAGQGHSVTVAFGDHTNRNFVATAKQRRTSLNPRLISIPLVPTPRRLSWMLSTLPPTLPGAVTLAGLCARGNWDVAHLHGVGFPMVDFAAAVLRRFGTPYLFTIHGVPASPFRRGGLARYAISTYLRCFTQKTVDGAAVVSAVSASQLKDPHFPVESGTVIYNGIDNIVPQAVRPTLSGEPLRLLSIGRLSLNKGIDTAIRAVARVNAQRVMACLDIYGADGGDAAVLQSLVASTGESANIRFCGVFDPSERPRIFAEYDGLLVPSRVEGFGLAALEALASGLPVIASRVDGLSEFLSDGDAILVPPDDEHSLASAILALRDEGARAERVRLGFEKALQFQWPPILHQYELALESIAASGG